MITRINYLLVILFLIGCGSKPEINIKLDAKIKELDSLKVILADVSSKIETVKAEILELDPSKAVKPKLVSTMMISPEGFHHFIDLQGVVSSENVSYIAPRNGMGGYVKQIYIKAGQNVKKGQLILKLDDKMIRQGIETTKTQLGLAKNIYDRTKNLWDQNIGTEVQLLSAKNNVESLENQIKLQQEQLSTFTVYADQSGVADVVNVKVGELFSGMGVAGPQIQIVNNSNLKVNIEIPENYTGKIKEGAIVEVEIPAISKSFKTKIDRLSASINAASRGFLAVCSIPSTPGAKPNMAAYVKILNRSNSKAMVVPVNLVQSDTKGKYVFVLKEKDGKKLAQKVNVLLGQMYGDDIEILSGLSSGDQVIVQGYQNLYEGQIIENNQ